MIWRVCDKSLQCQQIREKDGRRNIQNKNDRQMSDSRGLCLWIDLKYVVIETGNLT